MSLYLPYMDDAPAPPSVPEIEMVSVRADVLAMQASTNEMCKYLGFGAALGAIFHSSYGLAITYIAHDYYGPADFLIDTAAMLVAWTPFVISLRRARRQTRAVQAETRRRLEAAWDLTTRKIRPSYPASAANQGGSSMLAILPTFKVTEIEEYFGPVEVDVDGGILGYRIAPGPGQKEVWQIINEHTVLHMCEMSQIGFDSPVRRALDQLSLGYATSQQDMTITEAQAATIAVVRWFHAVGDKRFSEANERGEIRWPREGANS